MSDGLSYSVWLPAGGARPRAGVVILHGAGSCKENHHDFARAALAAGLAAIAFDQRGHGASEGALDGRAIADVVTIAGTLRERAGDPELPVALRGSSMGGYLAIAAAAPASARAVVAICPASASGLLTALRRPEGVGFDADAPALERLLAEHDLHDAVPALAIPLLLLHAEGDEQVPIAHSRELAALSNVADSRLIAVPGGHHRSVQHDEELQAASLRFIARTLSQD